MITTLEVKLNFTDLFQEDSDEGVFLVRFSGPKAFSANHDVVAVMLLQAFAIKPTDILQLYRFERPGDFFVKFAPEIVGKINAHGKSMSHDGYHAVITENKKQKQKSVIHWLPPTATEDAVRTIASNFLTGAFDIIKIRSASDRWLVLHDKGEKVPHYINLTARGPDGNLRRHVVMVTQPGRRQVCRHCSSDEHWTTACPTKREKRATRTPTDLMEVTSQEPTPNVNDQHIQKQQEPQQQPRKQQQQQQQQQQQPQPPPKKQQSEHSTHCKEQQEQNEPFIEVVRKRRYRTASSTASSPEIKTQKSQTPVLYSSDDDFDTVPARSYKDALAEPVTPPKLVIDESR